MISIVDDCVIVAILYGIDDVVIETQCLRRTAGIVPFDASQVVDDVATGENQVSLIAQWCQFLTEVYSSCGVRSRFTESWTTGISASGNIWINIVQVPWSMPHWSLMDTAGPSRFCTDRVRLASPGTG